MAKRILHCAVYVTSVVVCMKLWQTDLVCDLAEFDSSQTPQCIKEVVPGQASSLRHTTGVLQPSI